MKRFTLAVGMNVVVPGTGLILLGRQWLGLALAVWFGLAVEIAVCGWLIAPATMPAFMTLTAASFAGIAWVLAQRLCLRRVRHLRDLSLLTRPRRAESD